MKENAKKLSGPVTLNTSGIGLVIRFNGNINFNNTKLTLDTDESYVLQVSLVDGKVGCDKRIKNVE